MAAGVDDGLLVDVFNGVRVGVGVKVNVGVKVGACVAMNRVAVGA